jgi:hypothetical protein
MSSNNQSNDTVSVKHKRNIGQLIFSALVLLAFVGVVITDISPSNAHFYWVVLLVVYASVAIYSGRKQASIKGEHLGGLVLRQMIHWGGALVAILCVYTFLHTGAITDEEAGLFILLLVALATFLAGSHVGWRYYVLGALLALITVVAVYIEEFMWIIMLVGIAIIGITFYWGKHKEKAVNG